MHPLIGGVEILTLTKFSLESQVVEGRVKRERESEKSFETFSVSSGITSQVRTKEKRNFKATRNLDQEDFAKMSVSTVSAHEDILRSVPNFPYYTQETFAYPERLVRKFKDSLVVFGPPIHLYYDFRPLKSCQVHVSGIPDWASMSDVVEIFERFGKIFTIELSVSIRTKYGGQQNLSCNGWARVTYISYDGAQKALFAHLTRRISGCVIPLSIYKGIVSNVVHVKNIPANEPRGQVIERLSDFPGLMGISFLNSTTARMVFVGLDPALLFMDVVSSGGLEIDGFTCTVEPENEEEDDEDLESMCL